MTLTMVERFTCNNKNQNGNEAERFRNWVRHYMERFSILVCDPNTEVVYL